VSRLDEIRERLERATRGDDYVRADVEALLKMVEEKDRAIREAMNNLGVPQPGYPAPVAVAYDILEKALGHTGAGGSDAKG
jgi:hypothetical protein